jgi:SAM-dependent methyltransferase
VVVTGHDDGMANHAHAHGHAHNDEHEPFDWSVRGSEMINAAEVVAPMVEQAIGWLVGQLPDARTVLDVGSGPGVAACCFAQQFADAEVVAADGALPLLDLARERADRLGVRLVTRQVSLPEGLVDLPPADLVWASGVVHHLSDPVQTLRALGALVRENGLLAIREGGLSMRFLPEGVAPGLLARMEAVGEDLVARREHPLGVVAHEGGWPDLLAAAGLRPTGSRSFLLDLPAPIAPEVRQFLRMRLSTMLTFLGEHLSPADRESLSTLVDPTDRTLEREDLFLLAVTTVYTARPV